MEILSQTDILVNPKWVLPLFIGSVFCLFCITITIAIGFENLSDFVASICAILFFVSVIGLGFSIYAHENMQVDSGRDRYEVLLNEKVDMEEFYSKYNIIEKKDRIWVIEDGNF